MSERYDLYDLEFDREAEPEEDGKDYLFTEEEMRKARRRRHLCVL